MRMLQWLVPLLVIGWVFSGCEKKEREHLAVKVMVPDSSEQVAITAFGDSVATMLMKTLKKAVLEAMEAGGPVNAIQVCNTKALPLTRGVAGRFERPVDIKRTSTRIRNPENQPDSLEKQVLVYFEKQLRETGTLPPYVAQVIVKGDTRYYRYYKPMKVAPLCLTCHGDPKNMGEPLRETLKRLYPRDQATGYQEGDFRGVIRVEWVAAVGKN
ncbi:MAG: DUF3365 domain-containing protein [Calditrichaeota bacterium]|nr:DUF3365 domain-containing protein [Calditrichota bacterium]